MDIRSLFGVAGVGILGVAVNALFFLAHQEMPERSDIQIEQLKQFYGCNKSGIVPVQCFYL